MIAFECIENIFYNFSKGKIYIPYEILGKDGNLSSFKIKDDDGDGFFVTLSNVPDFLRLIKYKIS